MRFLNIDQLNYKIGEKKLFTNFRLQINARKVVGISGPSGCGKSTLLRMIANKKIASNAAARSFEVSSSKIFYIPQKNGLLPWYNLRRNMHFFQSQSISSAYEPQELAELLGLQSCLESYPSELSGGEYQRGVLACGISSNPELLIIDEPFTGVDLMTRWKILDFLKKYCETKCTIIVSHDTSILTYMCSDIVLTKGYFSPENTKFFENNVNSRDSNEFHEMVDKINDFFRIAP